VKSFKAIRRNTEKQAQALSAPKAAGFVKFDQTYLQLHCSTHMQNRSSLLLTLWLHSIGFMF